MVLDLGNFAGSTPDPFQLLRLDNRPRNCSNPKSVENANVVANLHFLGRDLLDKTALLPE